MRAWVRAWILSLFWIAVFACPAMAFVPRSGNTVVVSQAVQDDLYLAGGTVTTTAVVDGDVVAAGGTVDLGGGVMGGVLAAGGTLTVSGAIGRSLRAAAGTVTLDAQIMGDAVIAGGVVRIPSAARIGRDLAVGASTVNLAGTVGRNAMIGGGNVVIGGAIHGDAEIQANRIILLPTARIGGALRYSADQPLEVQAGAQVAGATTQVPRSPRPRGMAGSLLSPHFGLVRSVAEVIALLVLGFVTFAVAPVGASAVVREARERFWHSLVIGFVLLVSLPVAALLLMFTVVAIPLSATAMLLYFATVYPGQLFVAAWLGQATLTRLGRETAPSVHWSIIAGVLILVIGFAIPFAGWLIRLFALCSGFGALWVTLWAGLTSRPAPSRA